MGDKELAYKFLVGLAARLESSLPKPERMKARIPEILNEWAALPKSPMKFAENAFLYGAALPLIFQEMTTVPGIGPEEARQSLLCEYHACAPELASGNAFRRMGYPFKKRANVTTAELIELWNKPVTSPPPNQAFPDLAFRAPFPHAIVFDAKYFDGRSHGAAESALVDGIYEAAFYRGLPSSPATVTGGAGWNYEYGCLLAYDASEAGLLRTVWENVKAKRLFWEGGNLFVMILRGAL